VSISSSHGHARTTIDDIPSIDEHAVDDEELPSILDERSKRIVRRLRQAEKLSVGSICGTHPLYYIEMEIQYAEHPDISGKNPSTSYPSTSTLRTLLPLFASGLHRIALSRPYEDPLVLTDVAVIEHLVSLKHDEQPPLFELAVTAPSAGFPLHPLISLPGTASVLDAMQVMSLNGLSGLGVLSGSGSSARARRESSGSSGSGSSSSGYVGWNVHRTMSSSALTASPAVSPAADLLANPFDMYGGVNGPASESGQLMSVVTAEECTRVVVPSEGKQVLGMGLGEMVRKVQYVEAAGRERGEERVPGMPIDQLLQHTSPNMP
jgi:CBS domain-containing protein